jgi:hypothetical protein
MQELDNPVMVIIREHDHISPHDFHDHREMLNHGIYGLTEEMSEVLVLSPVGLKEPSLNLSVPDMSIHQLLPNLHAKSFVQTRSNSNLHRERYR